ncbi:uncharacterized protein LOC131938708, partial [Physella acuta]|uniref:uncharacterized protein LOC131938708 n=1 Tax=Physella acuta TaxID=109671 RepID=UPI0027DCF399
ARRDQFALADKSRTSSTSTENDLDLDTNFMEVIESRERVCFDLNNLEPNESSSKVDDLLSQKRMNYLRSASDLSIVRQKPDSRPLQQLQTRTHRPLEATHSLQGQPPQVATVGFLGLSPDWRRHQLRKMGDTIDNGRASEKTSKFEKDRSLSLPPVLEESALSYLNYNRQLSMRTSRTVPAESGVHWSGSSTSTDNSDDVVADARHKLVGRSASDREAYDTDAAIGTVISDTTSEESSPDGDRVSELEKELIATKCELAKVLNRQSCFQEILKQKDEIIEDLDEKLGNKSVNHDGYDSKKRLTAANKEHLERVRVLQNQNRFLNEEVRRLAKLRCQEHEKIKVQDSKVKKLEADIEVWKLEYISLIQSSIRFTGTDTMDDAELSLFGGDRHKNRIISLLEEARKINPSLPTFEHLSSGEVHVDTYGFKHHFSDEGLLLHYLCQELSQHFLCQANSYEKHQRNWIQYLKINCKNLMINKKTLKALTRDGIPDVHRKIVWRAFVMSQVEDVVLEKGAHYFRSLCSAVPDSPLAARYRKQISLDLMRTMPSNVKFSTQGSKGIMDLQDVLLAFCIHNPQVGYCQGMNFLVAMALLFMDPQDAFWTLVAVTERYHSPSYFDHNLLGAQADQMVLRDLMSEKMPELAKHLDAIDIEISTVTLNWFLALFFDAVPFQTLLRIWDCFLLEGPKVLFRFSLAILHIHSKEIILKCDTISVMRHLKACARITYDVDGLVRAAFKTLKPFPRRQDIVSKQTCYLNALKEKYRWRDMQRAAFAERENVFLRMECDAEKYTGFECCTVTKPGEAWVAYGEPPISKICIVDCKEQTMIDTNITFETRVMSMVYVNHDMVLIGTLSWFVYAYSEITKEMMWQQRVHDAVLSMQAYQDDEGDNSYRLFAGLADGTVAVFEQAISPSCTSYDLFYLPIGQSPVTCLQVIGNLLWCACGNNVSVIHASTLDPKDRFTVSANPYDTILSLVPGLPGVWISVRGSSVLELWDQESLTCRMLYDTRTGQFPNLRKEDDTYFNAARITSILSLDYSVWIGTGEGILITFDVFPNSQKTPSESSPFITDALLNDDVEMHSWRSSPHKSDTDSLSRLIEVKKRVKELYCERIVSEKLPQQVEDNSSLNESSSPCFEQEKSIEKKKSETNKGSLEKCEHSENLESREERSILVDDGKEEVLSKIDLMKTLSTESAKTDLSLATTTSGISSNLSHQTDASEAASMQDSGFVQLSGQVSGSSSHGEIMTEVHVGIPEESDDIMSAGLVDNHRTHTDSSASLPQIKCVHDGVVRVTRKSEDSGVSSLCEKNIEDSNLKTDNSCDKNVSESVVNKAVIDPCTDLIYLMNLKNMQPVTDSTLKEGFITSTSRLQENVCEIDKSGIKLSDAMLELKERNGNVPSLNLNGRSVSEESTKTNESDDVFIEKMAPLVYPSESLNMFHNNNVHCLPVGDLKSLPEGNLSLVSSDVDSSESTSNKTLTQGSQSNLEDSLSNGFHDDTHNTPYFNTSRGKTDALSLKSHHTNVKALAQKFETEGKITDTGILRRTQSLKKNFKVDPKLSVVKPFKGLNEEITMNGDEWLKKEALIDQEVEIDSSANSQTLDEFSSLRGVTVDGVSSAGGDDVSLPSGGAQSSTPLTNSNTTNSMQAGHTPINSSKIVQQAKPTEAPTQPGSDQQRLQVKNIDTKFYGDSDEDTSVHEARVQSFKDSYKRSAAGSKFKLLNDVIPEHPNSSIKKSGSSSSLSKALVTTNVVKDFSGAKNSITTIDNSARLLLESKQNLATKIPLSVIGRQNSDASLILGNMQSKDPDAQWRLDYTNIHVDTDLESLGMSSASCNGQGGDGDSQPPSRRLSCVSTGSDMKDQRLNQFLRDTASSYSSQFGPSSEEDKQMTAFLATPNMSGCNSATWSSYDEISTPPHTDSDSVRCPFPRYSAYDIESRATSITSAMDLCGGTELSLMSKNKISDKPVKWLVSTMSQGCPVVLSFSGSHSDDEAVLIWSREVNETLWTNAPVLEYNPATRTATLPRYMRTQQLSNASSALSTPRQRNKSQNSN